MNKRQKLLRNLVWGLLLSGIFLVTACGSAEDIQQTRAVEAAAASERACNDIRATRVASLARCQEETADLVEAQTCISEAQAYFIDWEAQNQCDLPPLEVAPLATATATAVVDEVEPTETPTPLPALLTLVDVQSEVADCTQEQEGHFFFLTCDFNLAVVIEYQAPLTPAYFYCRGRTTGASGAASIELNEPAGTTTLLLSIAGTRKMYEDDDQNGAADPPVDDGDNMFTNPIPENDGIFFPLSCGLSEFEYRDESAWQLFTCPHPDNEEPGDCLAPWLSRAEAHAWD